MSRLNSVLLLLVQLPRLVRIIIALFFATMVTLAIFALVDHIYIRYFFTMETRMIPAFVTVAIASVMYIWGWLGFVGTIDTIPASSNSLLLYFGVGFVATFTVIMLVIQGLSQI
jgi:hypothetical protein